MHDADTPAKLDLSPLPGKQTGEALREVIGLMQRLLAPGGCPWDREQTLETLRPYLVEETYEVLDALAAGDVDGHREELGDLLLQIVFQSELRHAAGSFGIDDVARGLVQKLVRRHPHVFGAERAANAAEALASWARLKAEEKSLKSGGARASALDGVPSGAPALLRAARMGEKASAVGFDFADADEPRRKLDEELAELDAARASGDRTAVERELGDVLFAATNLARKLGLDAESAARAAGDRFAARFRHLEAALAAEGRTPKDLPAAELERLWQAAKRAVG